MQLSDQEQYEAENSRVYRIPWKCEAVYIRHETYFWRV